MVSPYKNKQSGKKEQVAHMFNEIAHSYDFLNHTLSLGIDKIWRKKAIRNIKKYSPKTILDIASGTADFAITAAKKMNPDSIIGIDISENMLKKGTEKIAKKQLTSVISLEIGDCEQLRFSDNSFDATLTGFGVRNFENLQKGLDEIYRVLKPGGVACILEFSQPESFPIKQAYNFYFKKIVPCIGSLFSKNAHAYTYLPNSVDAFPYGEAFLDAMKKAGFKNTRHIPLSFGIAMLYICEK